jgi:uncharacterized protein YndB with AHSA1/START domain
MSEPFRTGIDIEADPSAVFALLTDAANVVSWMGDYAVIDARPGGEFTLDINGVPIRGRYVEALN